MTWEELERAVAVLGLKGPVTPAEVKARHRALIKQFHPDAAGAENDRIREINEAYRIVADYCRGFRFAFSQEEFLNQHPEERLRRQFADNVVWRGGNE